MAVGSQMHAAMLTAIPSVPFNPRTADWIVFVVAVAVIVLIYVIRYLRSNRQEHQYIHHTADDQGGDAPDGSSAG